MRWQRASCAPGSLVAECRRHFDFHRILSSIHVPTLVLADADDDGVSDPGGEHRLKGVPHAWRLYRAAT